MLSDFGQIGVTQRTQRAFEGRDASVSWPTQGSPVVMPHDYKCNYGRWVYPEQRGKPADADGEKAIRHVGPYMAHPVPRSAGWTCSPLSIARSANTIVIFCAAQHE